MFRCLKDRRPVAAALALCLLLQLCLPGAHAFCIFNDAGSAITAYQMPVTSTSFKSVVQPGESSCCNWSDCGPMSPYGGGRCEPAVFCMKFGEDDIGTVTTNQVLQEMNGWLFKVLAGATGVLAGVLTANPGVGAAVAFGVNAGLSEADKELQKMIDYLGCNTIVKTYNGGIAYATADGQFSGAWGDGYVDPPAGTEDCPIAGTNPTAALQAQQEQEQEQQAQPSPSPSPVPTEPVVEMGGACGAGVGMCPDPQCCSQHGYCGETEEHCGARWGCQLGYGRCN